MNTTILPIHTIWLLDHFVEEARKAFGEGLVGVYLHGSAAMGCYNPEKSDLDLIVVVKDVPAYGQKLDFLEAVCLLNQQAPEKGIEMSVVTEEACRHFVYPTPFELHFSNAYKDEAASDPEGFVHRMMGKDPDLAAHFKILYHRGFVLYGPPVRELFQEPAARDYLASIEADAEDVAGHLQEDPLYGTLNLIRVLAFKKKNLLLSKREGALWALDQDDLKPYHPLIHKALEAYTEGTELADEGVQELCDELLRQIHDTELSSRRSWFRTSDGVEVCFEDQVVRVRADAPLKAQLKKGTDFTKSLFDAYQKHEGKPLQMSVRSLQGELRLHYIADQWFIKLEKIFRHPRLLHAFFHKMHVHTYQIDCGERSVDGNRLLFDFLGLFFGK